MVKKAGMADWTIHSFIVIVALGLASCETVGKLQNTGQRADAKFRVVDNEGVKSWQGTGDVNLKGRTTPLVLIVSNSLSAEHGFSIDSMGVKEVIKVAEEKTITVPLENIDKSVTEYRVYCQLHPKHGPATLTITGR